MAFIVHIGFPDFFRSLIKGSIVYSVAYSLKNIPIGSVLLTSDGGVPGGTIHAVQINITGDAGDDSGGLPRAMEVSDKIEAFLESKGISTHVGVLLTAGLQDAIQYWGGGNNYSLTEVDELLAQGKEVSPNE